MSTINIVQMGLGPLGRMISGYIAERPGLRIVGAVDPAPDIAGTVLQVGEGAESGIAAAGIRVASSLSAALAGRSADVAVITTVSDLKRITPQIEEAVSQGLSVVTTCEELVYPWRTAPELARRIDRAAKAGGVAVLSTGVNPGFLMDALPLFLSGVCRRIDVVRVRRIQDATSRRLPFRRKIGAGLSLRQFEEKRQDGSLRHVGLTESVHMIADGLGWELDQTTEELTAIVADRDFDTPGLLVSAGEAAGVQQIGKGYVGGEERISLLFRAAVGEAEPEDTVSIAGEPNIVSTIAGGLNGDVATCSIVANAIAAIREVAPGLHTMRDMPPIGCR